MMSPTALPNDATRRAAARRTALWLGVAVLAVFGGFFALAVLR